MADDADSFLTDVTTLRERARKSLDDGAVMPTYKGDPEKTIELLQSVVATELVCVLRYRMHAISAEGITSESVSGLDMRRVAGKAIEIVDRQTPAITVRLERQDGRIERAHRNCHIARVRGDAVIAGSQNGEDAIAAADRVAARSRRPLVAAGRGVVEIIAARPLKQIATGRRLVAQLRRGAGQQRSAQHFVAFDDPAVGREIAVGNERADHESAIIPFLDRGEVEPTDIDELGRRLDLQLHQVEQVRAPGDEASALALDQADRRVRRIGLSIREALHAPTSAAMRASFSSAVRPSALAFATSRMASTMFG